MQCLGTLQDGFLFATCQNPRVQKLITHNVRDEHEEGERNHQVKVPVRLHGLPQVVARRSGDIERHCLDNGMQWHLPTKWHWTEKAHLLHITV